VQIFEWDIVTIMEQIGHLYAESENSERQQCKVIEAPKQAAIVTGYSQRKKMHKTLAQFAFYRGHEKHLAVVPVVSTSHPGAWLQASASIQET